MAQLLNEVLEMQGRLGELTIYQRNGKLFVRPKHIRQPRRLSRKQLEMRERLAHNNRLWKTIRMGRERLFEGGAGPYYRFMSVNRLSPTVYLTRDQLYEGYTLLLPETVVSDGEMTAVEYRLGEVDGVAALLTNLTLEMAKEGRVLLYEFTQMVYGGRPKLKLKVERVNVEETMVVDGCLALTGERFGDEMKGFALVHEVEGHVAQQRVVTKCRYYEQFTTEEALQEAAKSYKGLTGN